MAETEIILEGLLHLTYHKILDELSGTKIEQGIIMGLRMWKFQGRFEEN